jgi:hypothetical protein
MRWTILLPTLLAGACATGADFVFPDESSRRCFAPCESFHGACLGQCSGYGFRQRELLDLLGDVVCSADCGLALKRCAMRCGGREAGDGPAAPPSAPLDPGTAGNRQAQLRAQLRKMRWEELSGKKKHLLIKGCADLYRRITAASPGGLPPGCPGAEPFQTRCRDLSPEVVHCLDPKHREREAEACSRAFGREDRDVARAMNAILIQCSPPRLPEPGSRPSSSSAPAPAPKPPAKQAGDREEPRR